MHIATNEGVLDAAVEVLEGKLRVRDIKFQRGGETLAGYVILPIDLTQILMLVAIATWSSRVAKHERGLGDAVPPQVVVPVIAALAFLWINAVVLRTIHFTTGVPYTPHALWQSTLVQATLSLLWSVIALTTMAIAVRRQWRVAWIAGAALLGAVVLKLFFVELAQTGTITRIVSFIGVGLLLLLIGYVAPVPPVRKESAR